MSVNLCLKACVFVLMVSYVLARACFMFACDYELVFVTVCVFTCYCAYVFVSLGVDASHFVCVCVCVC